MLWFYGAYNHFKIDKQVAGISRRVATDLGIFDNYTGKGRRSRAEQHVHRLLPAGTQAEAEARVLDAAAARVGPRPGQHVADVQGRVAARRQRPDVLQCERRQLHARLADGRAGRSGGRGRRRCSGPPTRWRVPAGLRSDLPQEAAAEDAVDATTCPNKGGSHDFKFGFECSRTRIATVTTGQSGPIRYSYAGADASVPPDRIRFVDTGAPGGYGTDWTVGPTLDRHYAGYAQDRWAPNNRLTFTLGVRLDYQSVGYGDAIRKPVITDVLAGRHPHLPDRTNGPRRRRSSTTRTRPASRRHLRPDRKGADRAEGVLRPVLQQPRRRLPGGQPGRQPIAEYNFLDQNRNGRYDGAVGTRFASACARGADSTPSVDPNSRRRPPRRSAARSRRQLPGESSARVTYVRKNVSDTAPFYGTNLVPAWVGQNHGPVDAGRSGERRSICSTCPMRLADQTDVQVYQTSPTATFNYDTIEFAYNKRVSQKFFVQTSADYQWRNDFRSPLVSNGYDISTSPLSADPIGINFHFNAEPGGAEPSGDHGVPPPVPGPVHVALRHRVLGELPVPERLPVLTRSSRTAAA